MGAMEATYDTDLFGSVIEAEARPRSVLHEWKEAIAKHGPLMPRASVPFCVELSNERVRQLIDKGRIATVWVHNREYVPFEALDLFLSEERKSGRPLKEYGLRDILTLKGRKKKT